MLCIYFFVSSSFLLSSLDLHSVVSLVSISAWLYFLWICQASYWFVLLPLLIYFQTFLWCGFWFPPHKYSQISFEEVGSFGKHIVALCLPYLYLFFICQFSVLSFAFWLWWLTPLQRYLLHVVNYWFSLLSNNPVTSVYFGAEITVCLAQCLYSLEIGCIIVCDPQKT